MDEAAQIVKSIDTTKMKSDMILASQVMLYHIKSGDLKGGLQLLREIAATVCKLMFFLDSILLTISFNRSISLFY
jgi:hypothetical protein